jgi:hypothetical protein
VRSRLKGWESGISRPRPALILFRVGLGPGNPGLGESLGICARQVASLENPFLPQPKTHRQKGKWMDIQELRSLVADDDKATLERIIAQAFENRAARRETERQFSRQIGDRFAHYLAECVHKPKPTSDRMSVGE